MKKVNFSVILFGGLVIASNSYASPVNVTYDEGTVFEVAESGFKNKLNVGLKTGYNYTKLNLRSGSDPDASSFDVGLARIQLGGEASSGVVGYQVQGDFAQAGINADNEFKLSNAYVFWKPSDWIKIKLGQMKQGFPAQFMVDDFSSQFYVRDSLATQYYNLGRNQGAVLGIHDPDEVFWLKLGVFNGESVFSFADGGYGEGQNHPGVDTDHRFVLAGRYNILGNVDWKSESDYGISEDLNWSVTAAYSFATNNYSIVDPVSNITLETDIDFQDVALGTQVRASGVSFNGEVFWRDWDPDGGEGDDGWGYYAQLGGFVSSDVELFGRFSGVDCKAISFTSAANYCTWSNDDDVFEYSAGASYHLGSKYHRVGLEYSFIDLGNDSGRQANDDQRLSVFLSTFF
ncbi:MAG: OprO/OprP family phosphate-selective porin [Deltaproteobacteria bacterium]|nr:OprO/OprP family phosphate-selective porin [Deltaproteobacteria bacterium]